MQSEIVAPADQGQTSCKRVAESLSDMGIFRGPWSMSVRLVEIGQLRTEQEAVGGRVNERYRDVTPRNVPLVGLSLALQSDLGSNTATGESIL